MILEEIYCLRAELVLNMCPYQKKVSSVLIKFILFSIRVKRSNNNFYSDYYFFTIQQTLKEVGRSTSKYKLFLKLRIFYVLYIAFRFKAILLTGIYKS